MSRAGKYPVEIVSGVNVTITDTAVIVKGPKGELRVPLDTRNADLVDVKVDGDKVVVTPRKNADEKQSRVMWGTMTRNIKNAVIGVTEGFCKNICMKGVGFKASVKDNDLVLIAGYSHDVVLPIPDGISVEIGAIENGIVNFAIKGIDKHLVGQFADKVCKVRKVEPYKGKGIYYKGQKIIRKRQKK